MARVGIIFGLLLCGLTAAAMIGSPQKMPVQFIPMMLGIPLLFCGVVSLNPHRRKHAMHAAAAVAMLGALAGSIRVLVCLSAMLQGAPVNRFGFRVIAVMSALCIIFVTICVVSFVQTRRAERKT
ncbi:MAG: hypothetical protein AB8B91_06055 [Rubripirellula sp.]